MRKRNSEFVLVFREEAEEDDEEVGQSDACSGSRSAGSGGEEEDDNGEEVEQNDASSGGEKEEDNGKEVEQSDASSGSRSIGNGDEDKEDNGEDVEQNDTSSGSKSASNGGEEEEEYDEEEKQNDTNKSNDGGDLAFQLVDGNCKFNIMGMNDFERKVNLSQCGRSYAVIAIMGPQSGGKSTLLNHLFGTKFKMMNEEDGRSQTTKGIWLARCPDIEPVTLVMDMEGTDGSERGEDTSFENRSALFALAIADVVLINIWFKDIGLNNAAKLPLLKTVFEQVLVPFCDKPRKITLMFVVRDKKESSPEKKLEAQLRKNVQKIWSTIQMPTGRNDIKLSDFFKVEVKFLPHYEYRLKDFKVEVEELKKRFVNSTAPGGLVGDQKDSASGFSTTVKIIWDEIMANKNLTLPSLQVMVATIRCDEIKEEKYESFEKNEVWCKLYQRKDNFFKRDFGKIVNSILNTCLSKYDAETAHFHEATRKNKREELKEKLLKCVEPVYQHNMGNLRLEYLRKFMEAIDRTSTDEQNTFASFADGCMKNCLQEFKKDCEATKIYLSNWDSLEYYAKLEFLMRKHISAKGEAKVDSKIRRLYEPDLKLKLLDRVRYLLCEETDPTWSKVRKQLKTVTKSTISELNVTLSEFTIDEEGRKKRIEGIENYAKEIIEAKAREESGRAKEHMMTKFLKIFKADRDWNNVQEINSAAKDAKYRPMDVLVGLTAIRLEDGVTDNIGHILCSALLGSGDPNLSKLMASYPWARHLLVLRDWEAIRAKAGNDIGHMLSSAVLGSGDPNTLKLLNSSSWPKVPSGRTLIKPIECKELWDMYLEEVEDAVNKAIKDFEAKGKLPCGCNCCTIT
ncbi:hypothetical protein L6164_003035 [Bauhinia variegata]|uniref:Uncharacterized protein n=1 Tax=Bauhinia variegata TaxID=167791 RepID=A0ACB9PZZ5_BAUVA|nr:hypothetical protein L6164_003035 [Bauhinia variegata]